MNAVTFLLDFYWAQSVHSALKCEFDFVGGRLGFEDVVRYLLETHKVSVDLRDADNKTVLFHAVTSSHTAILRYLLSAVSCAVL